MFINGEMVCKTIIFAGTIANAGLLYADELRVFRLPW